MRFIELEGVRYYYMMDLAREVGIRAVTTTYDRWAVKVGSEQTKKLPVATDRPGVGFNEVRFISEQGLRQLYPNLLGD